MSTIERRIAAALTSDIPSADIAALVAETEAAISQAEAAAEAEREMALDPLASPDAAKARTAMEDAAFTRDRLRTVLPRLQARLSEVKAAEYAARWESDFRQVEARRDELANEYAATYPRLVAQLVDLFECIEAVDKEVSRIKRFSRRDVWHSRVLPGGLLFLAALDPQTQCVQIKGYMDKLVRLLGGGAQSKA